jgi:broad specificity phosphatase PhoE
VLLRRLRHPATASRGEQCIGQSDVVLSAESLAAIDYIARRAKRAKPDRILPSDVLRWRVLAGAIAAGLDIHPEPHAIWRGFELELSCGRTAGRRRRDDNWSVVPDALHRAMEVEVPP